MVRRLTSFLVAIFATAALSSTAFAQHSAIVPGLGAQGGVGYFSLGGSDFEGINSGVGFQGAARYTWANGLQLQGGVSYNIHGVEGASEDFNVLGIFAEPRFLFRTGSSNLAPYIGGRLSYLHNSISSGGIDLSANGWAFGGVGGLLFQVARQVGLEVEVLFVAINFGDVKVNNLSVPDTDSSGNTLGIKGGIVVSFGS